MAPELLTEKFANKYIFIKVNEKLCKLTGWHPVDAFETTE